MTTETAPLPPPPLPPPPPPQEPPPPLPPPPPGVAVDLAAASVAASNPIRQTTLSSACSALERLRSLHSERQACALFSSSLLSHPLGGAGRRDPGNDDGEDAAFVASGRSNGAGAGVNPLLDPLHPSSLPGGVRDAWASLSRSARPLNVSGGEVDDVLDGGEDSGGIVGAGGGGGGAFSSALAEGTVVTASMIENELARERKHENEEYDLSDGQLSVACRTASLKAAMAREGELAEQLEREARGCAGVLEGARREIADAGRAYYGEYAEYADSNAGGGSAELMESFRQRLREVREYHSRNAVEGGEADPTLTALGGGTRGSNSLPTLLSGRKRKHGHPLADGYDIASLIATETAAVRSGEAYAPEELFGKYLDLVPIYDGEVRGMRHAFASPTTKGNGDDEKNGASSSAGVVSYLDFLSMLSRGLGASISESAKLRDRRKYARFLRELERYLSGFLKRTSPFLNVAAEVIAKAVASFEKEWGERGGVDGWERRAAEASMASDGPDPAGDGPANGAAGIDLAKYATSAELERDVGGDGLKSELARLGLKCGGTVSDRAARLFLTKDTPLDKLPAKVFAKKRKGAGARTANASAGGVVRNGTSENGSESVADRRVDVARLESVVSSLLDQLRPTLEGTRRRVERRATQTENERDQELEEEINGASAADDSNPRDGDKRTGGGGNDSDEEDEDDAPVYNPKNVPLGWDGKPIPYWLFKLHGLNHFYPCEICGNESYRGRRNFEKHFTESRHSYGMRCLGIPNTRHFHGVTKIADAQELWGRLRKALEGNRFDVDQEEEYEDSHGNVLNRAQYEDLARQGLL